MPTRLAIRRFVTAAPRGQEHRVARLAQAVVRDRLAAALADADVPAGLWCVRRLHLRIGLDPDDGDAAASRAWADAVVAGLLGALASGDPDVVHYAGPEQALVDLVASVAVGRLDRAWAWIRAGVRAEGDPEPGPAPGAAIVTALRRHHRSTPEACLPALLAATRRAGLPALHRVLGGAGPRLEGGGWAAVAALLAPVPDGGGPPGWPAVAPTDVGAGGGAVAQRNLARELHGRSAFAAAVARARLRPDDADARAWAALVTAESDRSALHRPDAADVLRAVATLVADVGPPDDPAPPTDQAPVPATGAAATSGVAAPTRSAVSEAVSVSRAVSEAVSEAVPEAVSEAVPQAASRAASSTPAVDEDGGTPDAVDPHTGPRSHPDPPGDDDRDAAPVRWDTRWAGLLFLLALAPAVGLPHRALADPDLAGRSLPWVLQAVAVTLLSLPGDDPALAAFAGLDPAEPSAWDAGPAATPAERASVARLAERWAAATAHALDRSPADAATTVRAVAARRGTVLYSPGWIEVGLALDDVDVDVRVAGLDLDPGWVPWLGCVLRYRYG